VALSPFDAGYTSTWITTEDPCISTHEHYCVHGNCKSIDGLLEPVCTCWKDYDGERCEIHSLGSKTEESGSTKLAQTVLVIVAVVLSVISCLAILQTSSHVSFNLTEKEVRLLRRNYRR
uniref:Amphiregulin n=1 Tax=Takifugu rubripes TaxID=31033 RepID=A0A674MXD6_TAKRU